MVAGQKQLFLDDYCVAEMAGLTRTLHQPTKSPLNPIIAANYPWEYTTNPFEGDCRGGVLTWGGAVWVPDEEVYKCWYIPYGHWASRGLKLPEQFEWLPTALAVSRDGLYWEKPFVREVSWNGSLENNLVCAHGLMDVLYDPRDPNPNRRYKAVGFVLEPDSHHCATFTSPDGIHWSGPHVKIRSSDEFHLTYDDLREQFVVTVKCGNKYGRAVALATSRDFDNWTEPVYIFGADERDQEIGRQRIETAKADPDRIVSLYDDPEKYITDIYNMPVFNYEGVTIGMPAVFNQMGPLPQGNQGGICNVELTVSRDLKEWHRVADRAIFIPVGPKHHFDAGFLLACAYPQVRDEGIWFYYAAEPVPHAHNKVSHDDYGIGVAMLRRDGFVSLDAGEAGGTLLTRPLKLGGKGLYVNLLAPAGEARVEVLTEEGSPLPGFSAEECVPIPGDGVRLPVEWRGGPDLASFADRPVQLRFHLRNASLYAFWTE